LVISVVEAVCGGNFRASPENYPHIYDPPQRFQKTHRPYYIIDCGAMIQ
jgi:hypothetical protein